MNWQKFLIRTPVYFAIALVTVVFVSGGVAALVEFFVGP